MIFIYKFSKFLIINHSQNTQKMTPFLRIMLFHKIIILKVQMYLLIYDFLNLYFCVIQDQISDWFDSLAECLHWNVRKKQKNLDELTDLTDGK